MGYHINVQMYLQCCISARLIYKVVIIHSDTRRRHSDMFCKVLNGLLNLTHIHSDTSRRHPDMSCNVLNGLLNPSHKIIFKNCVFINHLSMRRRWKEPVFLSQKRKILMSKATKHDLHSSPKISILITSRHALQLVDNNWTITASQDSVSLSQVGN